MNDDDGADQRARRRRGLDTFAEVNGFAIPDPGEGSAANPLVELMVDHVFGDVWNRAGLTRKERRWIAITSVAAAGAEQALGIHVQGALTSGDITIEELREFVAHLAVYQGFPKASVASAVVEATWSRLADTER